LFIFASNRGGGDTGSTAAVNNLGTLKKTGSATTSQINVAVNNSGTVDVASGTLRFSNGGTDVGATYQGAGTVEFGGGTRTLDSASKITAANVTFSGGQTTVNGSYNVATRTNVSGGTATVAGTLSSLGTSLQISGGTLDIASAAATVATLAQSGGELTGSGTMTATWGSRG
jgi:hypothetical protein